MNDSNISPTTATISTAVLAAYSNAIEATLTDEQWQRITDAVAADIAALPEPEPEDGERWDGLS